MTHTPPIPDAAKSPYPAQPEARPHDEAAPAKAKAPDEAGQVGGVDKRIVAGVAGIAVGSAAVAAALLFAGRLSKPKSGADDAANQPAKPVKGDIGVD